MNRGYGTLKDVKIELEDENNDLDQAIFDLQGENLNPSSGACSSCLKCSSANVVFICGV